MTWHLYLFTNYKHWNAYKEEMFICLQIVWKIKTNMKQKILKIFRRKSVTYQESLGSCGCIPPSLSDRQSMGPALYNIPELGRCNKVQGQHKMLTAFWACALEQIWLEEEDEMMVHENAFLSLHCYWNWAHKQCKLIAGKSLLLLIQHITGKMRQQI